MRRFIATALAAAGILLSSFPALAASVWVADGDKLSRIDSATNQMAMTVKAEDIRQLAPAPDDSVWTLGKKHLTHYAPDGKVLSDIELKTYSLKSADQLALDAYDASLWITEGKDDQANDGNNGNGNNNNGNHNNDDGDGSARRIVHLDRVGKKLSEFNAPGKVRAFVVGLDQTLWILGNKQVWHLGANGALLAVNLTPGAHEVSFVYQPRVLLIGGVTSILGLLLVVVAALCRSPQPAA